MSSNLPAAAYVPGYVIEVNGYERVASAQCDTGTVVLLHNNSTHYLLVLTDGELPQNAGRVLVTEPYGSNTRATYLRMLRFMGDYAARWSSSLQED